MPTPPNERRLEDARELREDVAALLDTLSHAPANCDNEVFRFSVARVATCARAHGLAPEHLLIVIKRVTMGDSPHHPSQWWRRALTERAVQWSIRAYHRQPLDSAQ